MSMTESQHQQCVMRWANLQSGKWPGLRLLFHVPNGGSRNKIEAARLKLQGVKPGVPDLFLPVARGGYHGLFIELKTEKGRTSAVQDEWITALNEQGYFAEVCHGWQSAVRVLEWYMGLREG